MEFRKGYLDQEGYYMYKGHFVEKLEPSGHFETYSQGQYWRADNEEGIKRLIDRIIKLKEEGKLK